MAGVTLANSRSHQRPERYRQNMKKSLMKKISWILFLSALVAFATGASPVWAKPALWKLSDPDTTICLFGTVHLLKAQTQWFDPDLKAAFESALMTNRNKRWTDWLVKRLDTPGTVFVAVGAAHLAGDDSVQTMLKGRKLSVERIR